MKNTGIIAFLLATAMGITACKKDDEDPPTPTPTPTPTTGTIKVNLGFHWGTPEFELGGTYADGAGHAIQITTLKFFLSETHLENAGTVIADFHDSFILADAGEESSHTVGTANPGSFDHVEITIGLHDEINHGDPTTAEPPLNDATMHWNWNPAAGYKFLVIEGKVDDDGDGTVDAGDPDITYHCATDDALRVLSADHSGTITAGGTINMHVHLHVDDLVSGIDMLATPLAMGYEPVNVQLMDNLAAALEIE